MTHGSWNLDEAIVRRWQAANLDATFRATWTDPVATADQTYTPLNHQQARPEPPGPYATYNVGEPAPPGHQTGKTSTTEHQILQYPLTFQIHAKTNAEASGKLRGRDLARKVAEAFDPDQAIAIDDGDDCWIQSIRQPDNCLRLGDDEWVWILRFEIWVDARFST